MSGTGPYLHLTMQLEHQRDFSAELKLARALLTVGQSEQQAAAAEKYCSEAAQLCLARWAALPPLVAQSHVPLLHTFQQLVEVQEAAAVVSALQSSSGKSAADVSTTFDTWRHRMPNMWDDMGVWHDVLGWRLVVFEKLALQQSKPKKESAPTPSGPPPGSNETAFTLNQLAHAARLHKLRNVCQRTLTAVVRVTSLHSDELFAKAREQVFLLSS